MFPQNPCSNRQVFVVSTTCSRKSMFYARRLLVHSTPCQIVTAADASMSQALCIAGCFCSVRTATGYIAAFCVQHYPAACFAHSISFSAVMPSNTWLQQVVIHLVSFKRICMSACYAVPLETAATVQCCCRVNLNRTRHVGAAAYSCVTC